MNSNHKGVRIIKKLFIYFVLTAIAFSDYQGPDDAAGDESNIRGGRMNGNRILLYFENTTQQGDWVPGGLWDVSIWPNDGTGTRMVDGIGLLLGAKAYIYKDSTLDVDTLIVDDVDFLNSLSESVLAYQYHNVYFLQTDYREEVDVGESEAFGEVKWTLNPTEGYFNSSSETPAMSNDENSWPYSWPSIGSETKWPGEWNGRFGRGVRYADLATYFVANDAQDQEWVTYWECDGCNEVDCAQTFYDNQSECVNTCESSCTQHGNSLGYSYIPRPGEYIQNDATKQAGLPWGGLGIRVEARGFQWNNPLVRDALFWEYNISNTSEYNIPYMGFGYWVDNGIGGDSDDDEYGFFDTDLDLSFSWDEDNTGFGGISDFGIMGFAYLESPSLSFDGIDNDNDGIIDESRDNGIDDDGDWVGPDLDNDGSFDCTRVNDDVGLDGVGPNDYNYTTSDEGECNGVPDCVEGVGCEPNIDETDISESDMIGLTTFQLFPIDSHTAGDNTTKWFKNDDVMWNMMSDSVLHQFDDTPQNLVELFASATFTLEKGRTERISMAELHSFDALLDAPTSTTDAPWLFKLKKTVQVIYESDYRFASPPTIPTLTAEASDGKVILSWDNIAEASKDNFLPEYEPFIDDNSQGIPGEYDCDELGTGSDDYNCDEFEDLNGNGIWDGDFKYDFEGYKIYKSTDKYLQDAQVITDGFGNLIFKEPIFQCDKVDGVIDFANWAPITGTSVYMGDDSGIRHTFIDTDVQNGRTYYYAVVAYDYGMASSGDLDSGIPPAENNAIIELDANEYIINMGRNVVEVIPTFNSAGYLDPEIEINTDGIIGTGTVEAEVMLNSILTSDSEYKLTFTNQIIEQFGAYYISTDGFKVFRVNPTGLDSVYSENSSGFIGENLELYEITVNGNDINFWSLNTNPPVVTDVIDGFRLQINTFDTVKFDTSYWAIDEEPYYPYIVFNRNDFALSKSPWDISINFLYDSESYTTNPIYIAGQPIIDENNETHFIEFDNTEAFGFLWELNGGTPYTSSITTNFYAYNETLGDTLDLVIWDTNNNGEYDMIGDKIIIGNTHWSDMFNALVWDYAIAAFTMPDYFTRPSAGDVYEVLFERPFWSTDTISIKVGKTDSLNTELLNDEMENIKVVPNPYIATNVLEESIFNPNFNQRRRLMFTHLPAECKIKIYTISGVFVDQVDVYNNSNDGIAYWDLLNNEGLEVAAGMFIYHVKSSETSNVKMGKFSIIK